MRPLVLLLLAACSVWVYSCNKAYPPLPLYSEYSPLESGKFIVYAVDSIFYTETSENDTAKWQVMESVTDTFTDLEADIAWKIERFKRADEISTWQYDATWVAKSSPLGLERVENNLRFLRLVFPPSPGKQWQGHSFLGALEDIPVSEQCNKMTFLEDWVYTYEAVHQPYDTDSFYFDSTLTVIQNGEQNLISFNKSTEVYALNVGLVFRRFDHFTTQQICDNCPWSEKTECGYSVEYRLLSYN